MIGCFAPSQDGENWKHILLTDHLDVAYFLESKSIFISTLQTEKKNIIMFMKSI
jgi:hypothetical protein